MSDAGLDTWAQLFDQQNMFLGSGNSALPCIRVWIGKMESSAVRYVTKRNPYYWKIGPGGNQLLYIESVGINLISDPETAVLKTFMGEADPMGDYEGFMHCSLLKENEDMGTYGYCSGR